MWKVRLKKVFGRSGHIARKVPNRLSFAGYSASVIAYSRTALLNIPKVYQHLLKELACDELPVKR
ncbi:hypothetical protein BKK56_06445 [Rodentibacter genomosp. 2]|uniref:hypothetical protein n=1 Tax=Rodentibacter genomosp. 2 TaxID=1908266 RepID=UPI000986E0D5|nr:hypothetical protein BKK56_06445 [Rodentibacter genomosp. 2]